MGVEVFEQFNQSIIDKLEAKIAAPKRGKRKTDDDQETPLPSQSKDDHQDEVTEPVTKHGKLIIDATVAEQAIRFPTDLRLLNEVREISEDLVDTLYPLSDLKKKPRTYRENARKAGYPEFLGLTDRSGSHPQIPAPQSGTTADRSFSI